MGATWLSTISWLSTMMIDNMGVWFVVGDQVNRVRDTSRILACSGLTNSATFVETNSIG